MLIKLRLQQMREQVLYTDNFIIVTCHFINHNFQLKTYVIETKRFIGSHTASAIANYLDEVFITWNIQNKVTAVVIDTAAHVSCCQTTSRVY